MTAATYACIALSMEAFIFFLRFIEGEGLQQILIENGVQPLATIANRIHAPLKAGDAQEDDPSLRLFACWPRFFVYAEGSSSNC